MNHFDHETLVGLGEELMRCREPVPTVGVSTSADMAKAFQEVEANLCFATPKDRIFEGILELTPLRNSIK